MIKPRPGTNLLASLPKAPFGNLGLNGLNTGFGGIRKGGVGIRGAANGCTPGGIFGAPGIRGAGFGAGVPGTRAGFRLGRVGTLRGRDRLAGPRSGLGSGVGFGDGFGSAAEPG